MALVVKYGTDPDILEEVRRFRALPSHEKQRERQKRKKLEGREAAGK